MDPIHLAFEGGTLIVSGAAPEVLAELPHCRHDPRTGVFRAEGRHYRPLVEHLRREKIAYKDEARIWDVTPWPLRTSRDPFPHQTEALATWWNGGGRGVVVLPTGTGKTHVAVLAISKAARPALIVAPTIDLLHQWYGELALAFQVPIGVVGGGDYDFQPLTVTTYDSAHIHLERWGNRFGLLVFDECHHLPGPSYMNAAIGSLAPFRLGLTATPERTDGQEFVLTELIGPIVYRREIKELSGDYLAEYRAERLYVELSPEETERYRLARDLSPFRGREAHQHGRPARLAAFHSGDVPQQGGPPGLPGVPRTARRCRRPRRRSWKCWPACWSGTGAIGCWCSRTTTPRCTRSLAVSWCR